MKLKHVKTTARWGADRPSKAGDHPVNGSVIASIDARGHNL
ncbi:hypothetical protein [Rhizobium sp. Root708]|nr:hypothetical protein [Rhizobium sp. Root708]